MLKLYNLCYKRLSGTEFISAQASAALGSRCFYGAPWIRYSDTGIHYVNSYFETLSLSLSSTKFDLHNFINVSTSLAPSRPLLPLWVQLFEL